MEILYYFSSYYLLSFILSGFAIYFMLEKLKKHGKCYPPGPKGWPILGYTTFITDRPDEVIQTLQKQYGDIIMFPVGIRSVVVLSSIESIRESFVKQGDLFTGKPSGFQLLNYGMDYLGVFSEEGDSWKEQRKFTISALREFGVGKLAIENKVLEECDAFVQEIIKFGDSAFSVVPLFGKSTTNVISSVVFGDRYDYSDPEYIRWVDVCKQLDIALSNHTALDFFPLINKLPGWMTGLDHVHKILKEYHEHSSSKISHQIKTHKENSPRGFIDCFLDEMYKRNRDGGKNHVFDLHRLTINVLVLIIAGTVTTTMTLAWAIKLLLTNPNAMKKIVQEIDSVIGRERRPSWTDRANMPYTEAVLHEVQRMADLIPIGVARSNLEDAKILGYDIPKRSVIYVNTAKLHSDPKLWGDPENFRPERFIDTKTNTCVKPDYLLPFGIGRRSCPGDVLARMNMFLILTSFLQNFTLSWSGNTNPHKVGIGTPGIIRYLDEFNICAISRPK